MKNDICMNCGGWKGLHHWETMQCPLDGIEARAGQTPVWEQTIYRATYTDLEQRLINELELIKRDLNRLDTRGYLRPTVKRIDELMIDIES